MMMVVTGIQGSILEKSLFLSKGSNTVSDVAAPERSYYKDYISQQSAYLYPGWNPSTAVDSISKLNQPQLDLLLIQVLSLIHLLHLVLLQVFGDKKLKELSLMLLVIRHILLEVVLTMLLLVVLRFKATLGCFLMPMNFSLIKMR